MSGGFRKGPSFGGRSGSSTFSVVAESIAAPASDDAKLRRHGEGLGKPANLVSVGALPIPDPPIDSAFTQGGIF